MNKTKTMKNTEYRIPTINEFVEGFEYEINLMSHQLVKFDTDKELSEIIEQWDKCTVPDFNNLNITEATHPSGYVVRSMPDPSVEHTYWITINTCLQNNQIRVAK